MPNKRTSNRGMTLVELLIAIAIIAVLAFITAGVAPRVKLQAGEAKCLSNLRQLATGYNLYLNDNGGIYPTRFWSRAGQEGIVNYVGLSTQNILADTIFTCPTLQADPNLKSVDLLHRNYGINLFATTEKQSEGFNVRAANADPQRMMLLTEGRVLAEMTNANGITGKQYQTSTRSSHMPEGGGWNYPHGGHQNILFMDGRVQRMTRAEALESTSDPFFWYGHK